MRLPPGTNSRWNRWHLDPSNQTWLFGTGISRARELSKVQLHPTWRPTPFKRRSQTGSKKKTRAKLKGWFVEHISRDDLLMSRSTNSASIIFFFVCVIQSIQSVSTPLPLALLQANDRTLATLLTHGRPLDLEPSENMEAGSVQWMWLIWLMWLLISYLKLTFIQFKSAASILQWPSSWDNRVQGSWWKKSEQQTTNLNWLEQGTLCPTNLRFDSGGLEENLSFGMLWARDLEWQWLSWKHVSRCSGLVVVSDKKKYMTCYLSISEFDLRTPPNNTSQEITHTHIYIYIYLYIYHHISTKFNKGKMQKAATSHVHQIYVHSIHDRLRRTSGHTSH